MIDFDIDAAIEDQGRDGGITCGHRAQDGLCCRGHAEAGTDVAR